MAKSKKKSTLLLIAFFCSSLAHAQKQVPVEWKDSIDNGSNIKHYITQTKSPNQSILAGGFCLRKTLKTMGHLQKRVDSIAQ